MTTPLDEVFEQFEKLLPPMESAPQASEPADPAEAGSDTEGPAAAESETPAEPESPLKRLDHAKHGYHLELTAPPDKVIDAAIILDKAEFGIDMISGVDWPDDEQMEVIYDFYHPHGPHRVAVRSRIPRDNPEIPSITSIFAGALWHERETWEFYGIHFTGHPKLEHLLLPDDMEGYPLRKDFKAANVDA